MHLTGSATTKASADARRDDIRQLLVTRRHQLMSEIHDKVRDVREAGSDGHRAGVGLGEAAEAEPDDDLAFALIHLKGELMTRVDEALRQCDEGTYGACSDCGDGIASSRLRAIPFAVRCLECEETREAEQRRTRVHVQRVPPGVGVDIFA